MTSQVRERSLYSMRSLTLSQWRDVRMEVICGQWRWTVEVAMVLDVLKSRYGRIQRSSRLCQQQDLESAEIWSEKVRCSSEIKPRLRAESVGDRRVVYFRKFDANEHSNSWGKGMKLINFGFRRSKVLGHWRRRPKIALEASVSFSQPLGSSRCFQFPFLQ